MMTTGIRLGICVLAFAALSGVGFAEAEASCVKAEGFTEFRLTGVGEPPEPASSFKPVVLELQGVHRTDGDRSDMCGGYSSLGIGISNSRGITDGLRLDVVRGTSPEWWSGEWPFIIAVPINEKIGLDWGENAKTNQITYDFDVTATWIDKWGREGATSEPLRIHIPGVEESASCSQIGGQAPASYLVVWGVGLVGGLVLRRVRK